MKLHRLSSRTTTIYSLDDEGLVRGRRLTARLTSLNRINDRDNLEPIIQRLIPSTLPGYQQLVTGAQFDLHLSNSGARRWIPDYRDPDRYIEFPANRFLSGRTFQVKGNQHGIVEVGSDYDVEIRWNTDFMKFNVRVKNKPPATIDFDVLPVGMTEADVMAVLFGLRVYVETEPAFEEGDLPDKYLRVVTPTMSQGVLTFDYDPSDLLMPYIIDPSITQESINASADDAEEREGANATNITGTTINTVNTSVGPSVRDSGFRFTTIPLSGSGGSGDTITGAKFTTEVISTSNDDPSFNAGFEAIDNSVAYTTADNDIDDRPHTATVLAILETGVGAGEHTIGVLSGDNFGTSLQEVIDRAGWAENNAVSVLLTPDRTGSLVAYIIEAYDNAGTLEARLDVDFTEGGAAANPKGPLGMALHGPFGGPVG